MSCYSAQDYPLEKCKEMFSRLLKDTGRDGVERLLDFIANKSDFYSTPIILYSGREDVGEGALLRYSLTVYARMMMEFSQENMLLPAEKRCSGEEETKKLRNSIAIVGLLHGLYMANYFMLVTEKYLNPDTASFEDKQTVEVREDILGYGKGEESVYRLSGFIRLSREEAFAIRFQDGDFSEPNTARAYRQYPLALLLHTAILKTKYVDWR